MEIFSGNIKVLMSIYRDVKEDLHSSNENSYTQILDLLRKTENLEYNAYNIHRYKVLSVKTII